MLKTIRDTCPVSTRTACSLTVSPCHHACPLQPCTAPVTMHAPSQPCISPCNHTCPPATTLAPPQPCTCPCNHACPPTTTHAPATMHSPHNYTRPLVDRMTQMCKNITFPQTSFVGGNNIISARSHVTQHHARLTWKLKSSDNSKFDFSYVVFHLGWQPLPESTKMVYMALHLKIETCKGMNTPSGKWQTSKMPLDAWVDAWEKSSLTLGFQLF